MSGVNKSPITCHVLDSSVGKPAPNVEVRLQEYHAGVLGTGTDAFYQLGYGKTNADGRCIDLLLDKEGKIATELKAGGLYKIVFKTKEYFENTGRDSFYPWAEITFEVKNPSEHYHIPLLISPYSFTTYRGS